MNKTDLDNCVEQECKMIMADRQEKERIDAKNALEEYIYDMRARVNDELAAFITECDRNSFSKSLEELENWLYEDGEEQNKQTYNDKLSQLKHHGEPIKERQREFEERPRVLEEFGAALQLVRKAVDMFQNKDERYAHLGTSDMEKVQKAVNEKQTWLDKSLHALSRITPQQTPPVTVAQIRKEKEALESVVYPILNKPKPKAEPPKDNSASNAKNDAGNQKDQAAGSPQRQTAGTEDSNKDKMDLD